MAKSELPKGFLTLGQMARANNMTEKTLRFYQKKGILEPELVDQETGFRYYSILQSTKADLIGQLRLLGMSLGEIKEVSDAADIALLREKAAEQQAKLAEQRHELDLAERTAAALIRECDAYMNQPLLDEVVLELLPQRWRLEFDVPPLETISLCYSEASDSDLWEWIVRYVKNTIVENGWPISLFRNVGYIVPRDLLEDPLLWSKKAFVGVDESFGECFQQAKPFPSGPHLVLYVNQGYGSEGDAIDTDRFQTLLAYAEEHGAVLAGDPYCESICRFPRLLNQSYESLCRYCMPIAKSEKKTVPS